jgi:hypothetical protein
VATGNPPDAIHLMAGYQARAPSRHPTTVSGLGGGHFVSQHPAPTVAGILSWLSIGPAGIGDDPAGDVCPGKSP